MLRACAQNPPMSTGHPPDKMLLRVALSLRLYLAWRDPTCSPSLSGCLQLTAELHRCIRWLVTFESRGCSYIREHSRTSPSEHTNASMCGQTSATTTYILIHVNPVKQNKTTKQNTYSSMPTQYFNQWWLIVSEAVPEHENLPYVKFTPFKQGWPTCILLNNIFFKVTVLVIIFKCTSSPFENTNSMSARTCRWLKNIVSGLLSQELKRWCLSGQAPTLWEKLYFVYRFVAGRQLF